MKALTRYSIAIAFVLALSFASFAHGQEGQHSHPSLEGEIAEATAEIEALTAETVSLREAVNAQPGIDAAQDARLKAIEDALAAGPVDPPVEPPVDPDPVAPWTVWLVDLKTGAKAKFLDDAQSVGAGSYTVEVEETAVPPVAFKINGAQCSPPENNTPFHACGDNNPAPLVTGDNVIEIKAGNGKAATLKLKVLPPPTGPPVEPGTRSKLQTSDWYPASFNTMEVYANIIHAGSTVWSGDGKNTKELLDGGFIDRETGLPVKLPSGKTLTSDVYFTGNDDQTLDHWDGEWVLEADCTGDVQIALAYIPKERVRRISNCRLEFTRDRTADVHPTIYHHAIQITKLNGTLKNLRMYRAENEDRINAGIISGKRFADNMIGYDILRMMDGQSAGQATIRSLADVPSMDAAQWGNAEWQAPESFSKPFQGMPLSAPFKIAVETDTELWHHAPITLGAPEPFMDFRPDDGAIDVWAGAYREMARANAKTITESPEWDRYADALVAEMIKSGYPADRPLRTTLANEVWNFSGQYFMTTQYAWGIGEGLSYNGHEPLRVGYGALMARWKLALDGALKRAGRTQPVVYVIEGQAFFPERTMFALTGAKAYLISKGETWAEHAPDFGVSVASYWSATWEAFASSTEWPKLIEQDPDGTAKRFADFIINDPAQFGLNSVLDYLRRNKVYADIDGVPFIGAYEGGSHLERPAYVSKEWYAAFQWGEEGARVNIAVNKAIAETFPGFILSNYVLAGPTGGQPWFENIYGDENPYALSWDHFKK